ncbi:MAG: hypothetical protein GKR93_10640 [Gammaproteobacteria bacterium]|nr:hypothetical protein [Gammaproteobacteria bacterium]
MKASTNTPVENIRPGRVKKSSAKKKSNGAYWLLIIYFFIEYIRPQDYFGVLGVIKPAMLISIMLMLVWIAGGDRSAMKETPVSMFIVFIILAFISLAFVVNHYFAFNIAKTMVFYLTAGVLPLIAILDTEDRYSRFIGTWIFMHLFVSILGMIGGGKGPGSFLGDENDLALALNMALPYAWLLSQSSLVSKKKTLFYYGITLVIILGIVATFSRGGFLGLISVIGGVIILSRNKFRNIIILSILIGLVSLSLPDAYVDDMQTITDTGDKTRNDRIHSWKIGWVMFLDNPVLGVGTGNYPWQVSNYELKDDSIDPSSIRLHGGRAAHSLYFTLIPEYGLAGTIVYFIIIISMCLRLFHIIKIAKTAGPKAEDKIDFELMAKALLVSLAAFLVTGAFLSVLYYPHLWYLIGFVVALDKIAAKKYANT